MRYAAVALVAILFGLAVVPDSISTQGFSCPVLVESALSAADQFCASTGRNQACYGNAQITAEPQSSVVNFTFQQEGDIVEASTIQSMRLSGLDLDLGIWGVGLLKLQANLPDTLPGQNVTFLVFGDVEVTNAVGGSQQSPMQSVYLKNGPGGFTCEEAPADGVLIQTPAGAGRVEMSINGVHFDIGSTLFIQAFAGEFLIISTLDGLVIVEAFGTTQYVLPGTQVQVPIDDDLEPIGPPTDPEPYDEEIIFNLPVDLLDEPIVIYGALSLEAIQLALQQLLAGQALCGSPPWPPCQLVIQFVEPDENEAINGALTGSGNGSTGNATGLSNGSSTSTGSANGAANGQSNGSSDGEGDGSSDGSGSGNGSSDGEGDGSSDGEGDGSSDGNGNGSSDGQGTGGSTGGNGSSNGNAPGNKNGNAFGQGIGNQYGNSHHNSDDDDD